MQTIQNTSLFTQNEKSNAQQLWQEICEKLNNSVSKDDEKNLKELFKKTISQGLVQRNIFNLNPILEAMRTAIICIEEINLKQDVVLAIMLSVAIDVKNCDFERVKLQYKETTAHILQGILRTNKLHSLTDATANENFRNLIVTLAGDMRVVLVIIASMVNTLRQIRDTEQLQAKQKISKDAMQLYAPLAHKLGLYKIKSELEDLALKYLEHNAYYHIKEKLNATKKARDEYIDAFIKPIKEKLESGGLNFHIKGRTKSIYSIWQKMKRQNCDVEGIYDLFAIRIILQTEPKNEKIACWQAYSLITDMFRPNPKRLRDWLSVPKSNGYESLHITVLGPQDKWIEVQIRTERMDEIAEKGVAAHWKYKGIKAETGIDAWLDDIRNALEAGDEELATDSFKTGLDEKEVFVFTPKGDILRFPKGATVLDFAYRVHSKIGNACTGARINGKILTFRQQLKSGDQIEIITSPTQKPKQEWLAIARTPRAKAKIRLALNEAMAREIVFAKEMIERRFKNRKIEANDALMAKVIKKMGFRETTEFYRSVAQGLLDVGKVLNAFIELREKESITGSLKAKSAQEYMFSNENIQQINSNDNVLTIGRDVKGVDYKFAKCCNPMPGDRIFGFVTVSGGIKIHCNDCSNAPQLRQRFPYRVVKARWNDSHFVKNTVTLQVLGNDDIGVVNNLTGIIGKESDVSLRNMSIESKGGFFYGNLTLTLESISLLKPLVNKIRSIKGIKRVERL